jgi:competence protein ComGC
MKKGFTLQELIIVVFVIFVIGILVRGCIDANKPCAPGCEETEGWVSGNYVHTCTCTR